MGGERVQGVMFWGGEVGEGGGLIRAINILMYYTFPVKCCHKVWL